MLISPKQHQSNRRNAQRSTGPRTPQGKAAVRFNALTFGLRSRNMLLPTENHDEYEQLWEELAAEWQPETPTEKLYLEQMAASQWLLIRNARSEFEIAVAALPIGQHVALMASCSRQRASLERSFTSGLRELKQLQKERRAREQQSVHPIQPARPAPAPVPLPEPEIPHPAYIMSDASEAASAPPAFCAPATPDSR